MPMRIGGTKRATRVLGEEEQLRLLRRAVRLAKREGAYAARVTQYGSVVIELPWPSETSRTTTNVPQPAPVATDTAATGQRRRGGAATRRARSAARLLAFQEAKREQLKAAARRRLRDVLVRALRRVRWERMQQVKRDSLAQRDDAGGRSTGVKRGVDDLVGQRLTYAAAVRHSCAPSQAPASGPHAWSLESPAALAKRACASPPAPPLPPGMTGDGGEAEPRSSPSARGALAWPMMRRVHEMVASACPSLSSAKPCQPR